MHHIDVQVLNAALAWAEEHPVWLCTVLRTFGSSPRPPGAMMVIRSDGRYCGSLSGGCVEESFIARIGDDIFSFPSQIVRYGDGGFEPDQALPCGGALDILVEKLMPGKASLGYLRQMMSALTGPHSVVKALTIPEPCRSLLPGGVSEPDAYSGTGREHRADVVRPSQGGHCGPLQRRTLLR